MRPAPSATRQPAPSWTARQITIPNVPDNLTYCIVAALGIDVLATILAVGTGAVLPALIALVLAAMVYWFIYRGIASDVATARTAAAIIAVVHGIFALVALTMDNPFGFALDGIAAACLGFVFMQLRQQALR